MDSTSANLNQKQKARMALQGNRFGTPKLRELLREVGATFLSYYSILDSRCCRVISSSNIERFPSYNCRNVAYVCGNHANASSTINGSYQILVKKIKICYRLDKLI